MIGFVGKTVGAVARRSAAGLRRQHRVAAMPACVGRVLELGGNSNARFFGGDSELLEVPVPEMGDSITDGGIVEWVKGPGDTILVDDVIVVIETDKVNVDVRSEHNGKIVEIFGEIGDTVEVGDKLLIVEPLSAEEAAAAAAAGLLNFFVTMCHKNHVI